MVKTTIEFDLNTEEEREAHFAALQGIELRQVIDELVIYLKVAMHIETRHSRKEKELLAEVLEKIKSLLDAHKIR